MKGIIIVEVDTNSNSYHGRLSFTRSIFLVSSRYHSLPTDCQCPRTRMPQACACHSFASQADSRWVAARLREIRDRVKDAAQSGIPQLMTLDFNREGPVINNKFSFFLLFWTVNHQKKKRKENLVLKPGPYSIPIEYHIKTVSNTLFLS